MKVVVAPNSFKESLSAVEAAQAMAKGALKANPKAITALSPMADGGDGSMEVFLVSAQGKKHKIYYLTVKGPMGKPVSAHYGLANNIAIIEMAKASGLALLKPAERNPLRATSYGTGQLIRDALERGAKRIIVCAGGSATADAGAGALTALGAKFRDRKGNELPWGASPLTRLDRIDLSSLHTKLNQAELTVTVDVNNPLCGPHGQARIYGPQKGASPHMVRILEKALENFTRVVKKTTRIQLASMPGAGAAGGLAGGLAGLAGATLAPGAEYFAQITGLEEKIAGSNLVLTGEGRVDSQTLRGKCPAVVAMLAKRHKVPVVCLAGEIGNDLAKVKSDFTAVFSIAPGPINKEEAMKNAAKLLESATCQVVRLAKYALF